MVVTIGFCRLGDFVASFLFNLLAREVFDVCFVKGLRYLGRVINGWGLGYSSHVSRSTYNVCAQTGARYGA